MPRTPPGPENAPPILRERVAALESELADLESRLEHAQRLASLGLLAGSIAHEVNNILTPVLTYTEMARQNPGDRELGAKALERAAAGAERASLIATAILQLADAGGGDDPGAAADVRRCVQAALTCLARDPAKDDIKVTLELDPRCTAAIDPVCLQQVLLNLILNARRAMLPSGGRLVIRSRGIPAIDGPDGPPGCSTWNSARPAWNSKPGQADWIVLEVEDTGCGIAIAPLERIFDPFFTRAPGAGGGARGTGLGLTISRRLVERAGGTIRVWSEVGTGTRFTIELPAAAGVVQELRATA